MDRLTYILSMVLILSVTLIIYLYKECQQLELDLSYANASKESLGKAIELQNREIEKLRIIDREPVKADLSHIETPKDNTCETELKAYKQLFKELSK